MSCYIDNTEKGDDGLKLFEGVNRKASTIYSQTKCSR